MGESLQFDTHETTMAEVANCPVEDCTLTVDIVLKSSDGELLGAHQRNLEIYTEGFPIAGSTVVSDTVPLEETAEVLRLMLQYTHHIRQPSLDTVPFPLLASLSEAVEKYMIYAAMEVCKIKMTCAAYDHPDQVFIYSAKHNYLDLVEKAAKLTLKNPASEFLVLMREAGLCDDIAFRWLRYRDGWMEILLQLPTCVAEPHKKVQKGNCTAWNPFQLLVFDDVRRNVGTLDRFFDIVGKHEGRLHHCDICFSRKDAWISQVRDKVENLPNYSEA